ncbi:putative peptidylglycine alpha-hydroxylating monooxygenase 1 [Glandiceps talaboti]
MVEITCACLLLLVVTFVGTNVVDDLGVDIDAIHLTSVLDLHMPNVAPQQHDTYYCVSTDKINDIDSELYITKFEPHAEAETAHHMLLFGCYESGHEEGHVWNCGDAHMSSDADLDVTESPESTDVCSNGDGRLLYAWALNAPSLTLPKDVGFAIGGQTDIQYLVLQVHYGHVDKFLDGKTVDDSGVKLHMTSQKQTYHAGVYEMVTEGVVPGHGVVHMETACRYHEEQVLHPFAFRTHTHSHGLVVSGFRIRGDEWLEIGRKNPHLPQMFYPVENQDLTIRQDDILAARCTMENKSDQNVFTGSTMADEMCNFYFMFYTLSQKPLKLSECYKPSRYKWADHLNVPSYIDTLASTVPME